MNLIATAILVFLYMGIGMLVVHYFEDKQNWSHRREELIIVFWPLYMLHKLFNWLYGD
jgi:hypothetical protein